jgi:hypothetical protein
MCKTDISKPDTKTPAAANAKSLPGIPNQFLIHPFINRPILSRYFAGSSILGGPVAFVNYFFPEIRWLDMTSPLTPDTYDCARFWLENNKKQVSTFPFIITFDDPFSILSQQMLQ